MRACLGVLVTLLFVATRCPMQRYHQKFPCVYNVQGKLVSLHCQWNAISEHIIARKKDEVVTQIKNSGFIDLFWLGGTNHGFEPNFYWMGQNKAIGFTNWLVGESNNEGQEKCIHIWAAKNYEWNDWICSNKIHFVCEEDIEQ